MKRLPISEAARVTGVSRTTIQRAIRQGRLRKGQDGLVDLVDLANAGFRLLTDSGFVGTLVRNNEELEIENAQLRTNNDRLNQSLRDLEALTYRQSRNREKVRHLDLMPRPDAKVIYNLDAIPPTIVLSTANDSGLHPFSRQSVLSVLLFPHHTQDCFEQRQAWLEAEWASIVLETLEDATVTPFSDRLVQLDPKLVTTAIMCKSHSIRSEARNAFQRGSMAGAILLTLAQQKTSGDRASIRKACAHMAETFGRLAAAADFPLVTRTSRESLRRDWEKFRDVAHFWAAIILSATTSEPCPRVNPHGGSWHRHNPLPGFATIWPWRYYDIGDSEPLRQKMCGDMWSSNVDFTKFLAYSETFRRFGAVHRLHAQDNPVLGPQTTWIVGLPNGSSLFSPVSEIPSLDSVVPRLSAT